MIHCQTAREDQLEEMKELGILPAVKRINTIASEHPEFDKLSVYDLCGSGL